MILVLARQILILPTIIKVSLDITKDNSWNQNVLVLS
jgi:hypothetical protein